MHTARAWTTRSSSDQSKGLIKLDFSNAFNCIDREKVLQRTLAHFPQLARWAQWCYGRHSNLVFGSYTLNSECGVQQGDPLGPLLFATATQELALRLRQPLPSSPQQQP